MAAPDEIARESPVTFETAVAYALHPQMRRLIILYIIGILLLPFGMSMYLGPVMLPIVDQVVGLILVIVGATFLFGGLIGALFKLVTDATLLARRQ